MLFFNPTKWSAIQQFPIYELHHTKIFVRLDAIARCALCVHINELQSQSQKVKVQA